jgi:hypothetical protein
MPKQREGCLEPFIYITIAGVFMAIHMATLLNFDVGETEKVRFLNSSTHCIKAIFNFVLSKLHHIKLFFFKEHASI